MGFYCYYFKGMRWGFTFMVPFGFELHGLFGVYMLHVSFCGFEFEGVGGRLVG